MTIYCTDVNSNIFFRVVEGTMKMFVCIIFGILIPCCWVAVVDLILHFWVCHFRKATSHRSLYIFIFSVEY